MTVQNYTIATRFFTTIGHLTALLLLFSTIKNNVRVTLGDGASTVDEEEAYQTAIAALVMGIICIVVDFTGIFLGTTLFDSSVRENFISS